MRFQRLWFRPDNVAEALLGVIFIGMFSAGMVAAALPFIDDHRKRYLADCAQDATLACHSLTASNFDMIDAVFQEHSLSAGMTLDAAIVFCLLVAIGVHVRSKTRWVAGALAVMCPLIAMSIINVYRLPATDHPASFLAAVSFAIVARGLPFFLGLVVSRAGRSIEIARDRFIAGELLSSRSFRGEFRAALVSSLGLDAERFELVAREKAGAG